jgi:uncharacterized membrane protein YdbT with pleckstrin-like domain
MKYPESALAADEIIVFDVHHHISVLLKPMLLFAFGVWKLLVWIYTSLVLTDRRLVYRSGVFTRLSREIPLSRISDITTIQMFLGRIFSSGDLIITLDYSSGTEKSSFFRLPRPEKLKQDILKQAHALKAEAAGQENSSLASQIAHAVKREQPTYELPALPPERPPLYSEIVDQIERLDALRERGTLTDLEFEDAKQNLISRLKREPEN